MNQLRVVPATLNSVAAICASVGDDITSAATRIGGDVAALAVVFGPIGTEFVAATDASTRRHRESVAALAAEAQQITGHLRDARGAYDDTDDEAAGAIAAAGDDTVGARVA